MGAGAVFSLSLHGSVLACIIYWGDKKPGAIEPPTEAISLEAFRSEVLEAVEPSPLVAAASVQAVEAASGETAESIAAAQPSRAKEAREAKPHQDAEVQVTEVEVNASEPEGIDIVRGALDSEAGAGTEVTEQVPVAENARKTTAQQPADKAFEKPLNRPEPHAKRPPLSDAKQKGAARARAATGSQQSAGRVSASSGSAVNYAAVVRAQVAAHKPSGGGDRGTVVIAFSVAGSGALRSARIARSSGNPGLDNRVLAAVRSAGPFPPPPGGANTNFAMPFYFR
ncbi:TonB family protein [Hyphomicrobium sp.]|uniref:energy transducer TonB family protein n=1 Tax=Hyphomicrobium sp. TaxID=82 RepID=UPI002D7694DA|nr:TonB family protein [Hyphomicrobium sp.]HET6388292.1 TonB family protein [Hyphomicrobium sp.]